MKEVLSNSLCVVRLLASQFSGRKQSGWPFPPPGLWRVFAGKTLALDIKAEVQRWKMTDLKMIAERFH